MQNDLKEISYIDVIAQVRPTKLAFLIDDKISYNFILNEIIPWASSTWGGLTYFFVPISSTMLENHPQFPLWISLLQKYDPDAVVSTGSFQKNFLDLIGSNLLTNEDLFQFTSGVPIPQVIRKGHQYTLPLEDLFKHSPPQNGITEYTLTGQTLKDVWLFSQCGRMGKYQKTLAANGIQMHPRTITVADIDQNCDSIMHGTYPSPSNLTPIYHCMSYLGPAGALNIFTQYLDRQILILGEDIHDWALYQSLKLFYPWVYWIPQSFLSSSPNTGFPNSYDYALYRILTDANHQDHTIVTSASLNRSQIQSVLNASLGVVHRNHSTQPPAGFDINEDFNEIITNWNQWGEPNNFKEATMIFQDKHSLQKAPIIVPKQFNLPVGQSKFKIDLLTSDYKYLGHHMCNTVPTNWARPNIKLKGDTRRTFLGGITFNPVAHLTMSGQNLDSSIDGPRIFKQPLLDDFRDILSKKGLNIRKSIGSMNIDAVLGLWENDIEKFNKDYFENDSSKIFEVFKGKALAKQNGLHGVQKSSGISIQGKMYFAKFLTAFIPKLKSINTPLIDHWLENGVLVRGERLTCLTCGYIDFYQEREVNRVFLCKRCNEQNTRSLRTMGHVRPRYLYSMSPLIYGLQEQNSDTVLYGIKKLKENSRSYFEFTSEIQIMQGMQSIQEVDIVANIDGRLVVGEAKSNGVLGGPQLQNYVDFCRDFNIGGFACVSRNGWAQGTKLNIQSAFSQLKNTTLFFIS